MSLAQTDLGPLVRSINGGNVLPFPDKARDVFNQRRATLDTKWAEYRALKADFDARGISDPRLTELHQMLIKTEAMMLKWAEESGYP